MKSSVRKLKLYLTCKMSKLSTSFLWCMIYTVDPILWMIDDCTFISVCYHVHFLYEFKASNEVMVCMYGLWEFREIYDRNYLYKYTSKLVVNNFCVTCILQRQFHSVYDLVITLTLHHHHFICRCQYHSLIATRMILVLWKFNFGPVL